MNSALNSQKKANTLQKNYSFVQKIEKNRTFLSKFERKLENSRNQNGVMENDVISSKSIKRGTFAICNSIEFSSV